MRLLALGVVAVCQAIAPAQLRPQGWSRRSWMATGWFAAVAPSPAQALVKGNAPPPKSSRSGGRKCRDIDECEALGELKEQETFQASQEPFETTSDGVRYRDVRRRSERFTCDEDAQVATGETAAAGVQRGDVVQVKYRVMRLGKRSSDNLSGEASPVFSLGYGEDDDSAADVLTARVGTGELIEALDSAIVRPREAPSHIPDRRWACVPKANVASSLCPRRAGRRSTRRAQPSPTGRSIPVSQVPEGTRRLDYTVRRSRLGREHRCHRPGRRSARPGRRQRSLHRSCSTATAAQFRRPPPLGPSIRRRAHTRSRTLRQGLRLSLTPRYSPTPGLRARHADWHPTGPTRADHNSTGT